MFRRQGEVLSRGHRSTSEQTLRNPAVLQLRKALSELTFDSADALRSFDRYALGSEIGDPRSGAHDFSQALRDALFASGLVGEYKETAGGYEQCFAWLEGVMEPLGCIDVLDAYLAVFTEEGQEIFDMMAELNPSLVSRDVEFRVLDSGCDDHFFLPLRLSAGRRYLGPDGVLAGTEVRFLTPRGYW